MSALDKKIRRLMAQRAFLEHAAELAAAIPGPALQLGFGDGAAFDHWREVLRRREIFVFDRAISGEAAPPPELQVLGDPAETVPLAWDRFARSMALLHINLPEPSMLAPLVAPLLHRGAVVICEDILELPGWEPLPPPAGVRESRYCLYRAG